MTILGHIFGIIVVIFGLVLIVGIHRLSMKFDFDAPLFKIEINISDKKEDKD